MTRDPNLLSRLREQAATLDEQLVGLLDERAGLSRQVAASNLGESLIPGTRADWLASLERRTNDIPAASLRAILEQVAAAGVSLEAPSQVVYLGPEGSFCHEAALTHFGQESEYTVAESAAAALECLTRAGATHAIVPIESSLSGMIRGAIAGLSRSEFGLVREVTSVAVYSLMSVTENPADIEKLYVTARARGRCQRYIKKELPRVTVVDVRSPAEAITLALSDHGAAAIAPETFGRDQGLGVCQANVGDVPSVVYRYGIASARPTARSGRDTTCLLCNTEDSPGTLFQVLSHFAERGINVRKLQSTPLPGGLWDYVFYVELAGHITDRPVVTALEAVKGLTKYLKVIGSFPTDV